jgi:hypothetical protein
MCVLALSCWQSFSVAKTTSSYEVVTKLDAGMAGAETPIERRNLHKRVSLSGSLKLLDAKRKRKQNHDIDYVN